MRTAGALAGLRCSHLAPPVLARTRFAGEGAGGPHHAGLCLANTFAPAHAAICERVTRAWATALRA